MDKTKLITNSLIELGVQEDEGKGKGRYFQSKFIEAGIAHYEELGDILITKETLDKFIQTMVGCPVIIDHEDVNDKNVDKLRVGVISKVWYNEYDGWFWCEGVLTDNEAIDLIKNQGWSVSCAYSFVSDNQKKTYHGKEIDMEFVDGEFLHLAIVKNPRYEGAGIVVNSNENQKKDETTLTKDDIKEVENNKKENIVMQVLNELTEFIKNVVSNEKEDEMAVKNEDKRELIDEIGGILKDKVDEELWRTIVGKIEKIAYKPSEDDKADNEDDKEEKKTENKCKNEEDKKEEKEEKTENEDEEKEDKKEEKVTENEEDKEKEEKEDKKEVKNSMTDILMGGKGQVEEKRLYTSRKERLEEGNKY